MTTQKHKKEAVGKEKQPGTAPAAQASKPTEPKQISENVVLIGQKTSDELCYGLYNPLQPARCEESGCQG
jgi:hypothetical protein